MGRALKGYFCSEGCGSLVPIIVGMYDSFAVVAKLSLFALDVTVQPIKCHQ